ncbi:MAG TPA: hypothetical protein EYG73_12955 [Arcobacter sp.]|nr:hypothetical protein [Arcobacter sp.]
MGNSGVELKIGSELNEFTIKKVLGSGTFGITYLAKDNYLNKQVVIKEYFPNDIAIRNSDSTISAKTNNDKENFEYGLSSFLKEAQVLAKFNHPNVVRVNSFCESNNTAYFIMDYEKGKDLEDYLEENSHLNEEEILDIMIPLLDGLQEVHNKSYLHRDIKPGNIYIKDNNSPLLIDFGATRYSIGVKSQSLSIILTPGYAPKEQYSSKSKQAAYTDIYAIGAVMYKMVTDATPIEASERANAITDDEPDPHIKLSEMNYPNYSDSFKEAIDWALEFKPKDRPQSVTALKDAFNTKLKSSKKKKKENKVKETIIIEAPKEKNNNSTIIIGLLLLALAVGGFFFMKNNKENSNLEINSRVAQLEEENRRLAERKQLAEEDAKRSKQEIERKKEQYERERRAYEKSQEEIRVAESQKIDFSKKSYLDINNDNINLTLTYPIHVKRGNNIYITASLKNNGVYESRGGVTLSFPQLTSISGDVISNNFSTDIETYGRSDKIWSKATGGAIYAKYLMVESNNEKWSQYEKHSFKIALDSPPGNVKKLKIQVRGALKNRVVPGNGILDQQGYLSKVITITIVD